MDPPNDAPPDVIVVLGCRVPAGLKGGALERRAKVAARAFHQHRPAFVMASGGRRWRGVPEASALRDLLVQGGVPSPRIVRELWSLSTIENASYTYELLRGADLVRPLIVTCDWHLPRALACFAACGMRAVGLAAATPHESDFSRVKRRVLERMRTFMDLSTMPLWNVP